MADSKLFLLSLFLVFSFFINGVKPYDAQHSQVIEEIPTSSYGLDDSSINNIQSQKLHPKIQLLETRLDESNTKLKIKDEEILHLEKEIQDKSNTVASLQNEIEYIQKKGTSDAEERVEKAHARASELQKQIEMFEKQSEQQIKEKNALEIRARESENKIEEVSSTLMELQKINEEQKIKISKTDRALQVAEEEMVKVKLEINKLMMELMEVNGAWLPPWIFKHLMYSWSLLKEEWDEHGQPLLDILVQKAQEKRGQAEKWAEPHIETINTKWVPVVKEHVGPHIQTLSTKTVQVYESSKRVVKPHIIRGQELADPYYQEVKKLSKPYITQVATLAKPRVEKAKTVLKPYTKAAVRVYGRFLEQATTYHSRVQVSVHEKLNAHEFTRPLAFKELVWFAASALLALPVIILFRIFSAMFRKKSKSSRSYYARRKVKRGYVDE